MRWDIRKKSENTMEFILAKLKIILWPASKPPDKAGSQQTMSEDYQKMLRLQEK